MHLIEDSSESHMLKPVAIGPPATQPQIPFDDRAGQQSQWKGLKPQLRHLQRQRYSWVFRGASWPLSSLVQANIDGGCTINLELCVLPLRRPPITHSVIRKRPGFLGHANKIAVHL